MDKRNMILVTIDALRADHVGYYGYPRKTTPFIDKLASKSVVYKNAYSTGPYTKPAFKSIFTGHLPFSKGGYDNIYYLVTMAQIFRENGYITIGFPNTPVLSRIYGFSRGFKFYMEMKYREPIKRKIMRIKYVGPIIEAILYRMIKKLPLKFKKRHYMNAQQFVGFIRRLLEKTKSIIRHRNFFMWFHFMDPHSPYIPPDMRYCLLDNGDEITLVEARYYNKLLAKFLHGVDVKVTSKVVQKLRSLYDGEIRYLDSNLEAFWNMLDEYDLLDDTVVVLVSDHGDEFYEHGGLGHTGRKFITHIYNELLHVPLIIYSDALSQRDVDRYVSTLDLFSTVLHLAGVKKKVKTESLTLPLLNDDYKRIILLSEASYYNRFRMSCRIRYDERRVVSAILYPWKYILYESTPPREELYNLERDPYEKTNVVAEHRDVTSMFREYVKKRIKHTRRVHYRYWRLLERKK